MVFYIDVIIILITTVYNSDGGCHVNNWPHSCEANFRIGPEKCEPCESGRYGCNCSQVCTTGTFGLNCYFTCNCSDDESCDPSLGCIKINNTTVFTTPRTNSTKENMSAQSTFHSEIYSTSFPPVQLGNNLQLNEVIISLLVSSATVVFFSVVCALVLIRIIKRIYKREYRRLLNNLQLTDMRNGDENVYSEYNYTDSSMLNMRIYPSSNGDDFYDHSMKENYNILSLRSRTSRVNNYDVESNSTSPSQPLQSSDESRSDLVFEPECLINLFQENQAQQSDTRCDEEINTLIREANGTNFKQTASDLMLERNGVENQLVMDYSAPNPDKQEVRSCESLPEMVTYILTTVLVKLMQSADGGCHVNNWPHSCEANFRIGPEKCEPCEPGRYGCNCSQVCTTGTFGLNCYFTCNCSDDESCDPTLGCIKINNTSVFTTANSTTGTKSVENASGPAEENQDSHSYLTISDRSFRLYADVHYDEAAERKSSPSESLNNKADNSSSITDSSKKSDDYLIPTGKIEDENQYSGQLSDQDNVKHELVETCI
ncbi:uncharacterized protein LOC133205063 [Saccostrea echinata]|uniref:uncharacterized protein LOC133205063 n=1 Tax=Saccostrea echinata TaxID=191078 RepID=UPI002A83045D|nr:uncharacterized protein LOC133205063 [Saccostrea echinata]